MGGGDNVGELDREQLDRLASHFEDNIQFARHTGFRVNEVEPGRAELRLEVGESHLNGSGSMHGGVYASMLDEAMGLAVASLVGLRVATTQMNVHFLGAVHDGSVTCSAEVLHRTRRMATAEGRVYDEEGDLVALGTAAFRVFEKQGDPVV